MGSISNESALVQLVASFDLKAKLDLKNNKPVIF